MTNPVRVYPTPRGCTCPVDVGFGRGKRYHIVGYGGCAAAIEQEQAASFAYVHDASQMFTVRAALARFDPPLLADEPRIVMYVAGLDEWGVYSSDGRLIERRVRDGDRYVIGELVR